jgi:hypothetical protein
MIISDACNIDVLLALALVLARVIIMLISDATVWSVTGDSRVIIYIHNMFILQATSLYCPKIFS